MGAPSRGAVGAALLGGALILLAGLFDAEPLYVPGISLLALAILAVAWVRAAARGARVTRTVAGTRVQEGEPLLVEIEVRSGLVAVPSGEVRDALLARPARLGLARRRTRVRIRARFARRGRRTLAPAAVLITDPLGLAGAVVTTRGPADDVLVLPRVEPVRAPGRTGGRSAAGRSLRGAGAEADLDGLRVHRPGAPASRIAWQVYARTGELHERNLRAGGDARPLVVLDLAGAPDADRADAAVRAAASLVVHLAERGGCALLLPGERRAIAIDPGLRAWPAAHARLALVAPGRRPALAALSGRSGPVLWVSARALREPPRALLHTTGSARLLVVPATIAGRAARFTVAGCTGYEVGRRSRAPGRARVAAPGAGT